VGLGTSIKVFIVVLLDAIFLAEIAPGVLGGNA
jgi:hypothetical protein